MDSDVEVRLLGPLDVRVDGAALPLGAPKQQVVLARLAVSAGQVVSLDELIDEIWPVRPPASAVENARTYAANLRRLFDASEKGQGRIGRRGSGYLIHADTGEVDLFTFEAEARRAREAVANQELRAAVAAFGAARARWRGPMLAGLPCGPALTARSRAAEEERLILTEDLAETLIATDQLADALPLLREHTSTHPLRERAHALLMVAQYRAGDVAGSLATYTAARATLVDQLGVEPGAELQRLHCAVLGREPQLQGKGEKGTLSPLGPPFVVPHELPADIGDFVGREREVAQLRAILTLNPAERRRPAVAVLFGQGGVGKSALAAHVAHGIVSAFPDGQLYVDLLGSTPVLQPLTPVDALRRFLRSLGVPQDEIPSEESDAAARFRTVTTGRRILVVLDNANEVAQVAPLVPASPSCALVITSRSPCSVLDAEAHLRVEPLPAADGVELLHRLTGAGMVDKSTATEIVELCDHLPLAVRVTAGRLIARRDLSAADLVKRLQDRRLRLDELELDGIAVRACIRLSYEGLVASASPASQVAARAFRAIGLLSIPDFQPGVIAAMLGETDAAVARMALDHLISTQLVEPNGAGRYRVHDLVRLVAAEAHDGESRLMLYRGMTYYAMGVLRVEDRLRPGRLPLMGPRVKYDAQVPSVTRPDEARSWLEAELFNLIAVVEQASGVPEANWYTVHIGAALSTFIWQRSDWRSEHKIAEVALSTALRHGDHEMLGWAHWLMGRARFDLGAEGEAIDHLETARRMFHSAGQHVGVLLAVNGLGKIAGDIGRQAVALAHFEECVALAREHENPPREAMALHNLASVAIQLGRWQEAQSHLEASLAIAQKWDDRSRFAATMGMLAAVCCHFSDRRAALGFAERSCSHARLTGDPLRECESLLVISEVHLRDSRPVDAAAAGDSAVSLAVESRNSYLEAAGLRQLAKVAAATGQVERTATLHRETATAFARPNTRRDPVLEALLTETGPWLPDVFYR